MSDMDHDYLDALEREICGDIVTPQLRHGVAFLVQLVRAVADEYSRDHGVFAPRIDNALRRWRRDRSVR